MGVNYIAPGQRDSKPIGDIKRYYKAPVERKFGNLVLDIKGGKCEFAASARPTPRKRKSGHPETEIPIQPCRALNQRQ